MRRDDFGDRAYNEKKKESFKDKFKRFFIDPDHKEFVEVDEYEEDNGWGYDSGITRIDEYREGRTGASRNNIANDTISFQSKKSTPDVVENIVTPGSQIVKSEPKDVNEAYEICDLVKQGKIVVVKTEGVATLECQRIVDFLSGVVYSLGGEIDVLSNRIFIVAPKGVELSDHHVEQLKAHGLGIFSNFGRKSRN